ncbi:ricin-type beta-trefoil lectin domain protein [Streptomyces sp. NPDC003016]
MSSSAPAKRVLRGVAGVFALPAGASAPVVAAPAPSAASAAADFPEGVKFKIQNYRTQGCLLAESGFDQVNAPLHPGVDFCSAEHALWIQGSGDSIRSDFKERVQPGVHWCLAGAESGRVSTEPCDGGWNQRWTRFSEGFMKNWATKQCLDVRSESPYLVHTRGCLKHEWQKWAFKPV